MKTPAWASTAVALLCVVALATVAVGTADGAPGWPREHHDVGNTAHNPDAPGIENVTRAWTVDAGAPLIAPPVASEGRVVVATHDIRSPEANGTVIAIDEGSGDELWRTTVDGGVWTSLAIARDTVYVGTVAGSLYALDPVDGSVERRIDVGRPVLRAAAVASRTVVVKGVPPETVGDGPPYLERRRPSDDRFLLAAYEAGTGERRWQRTTTGYVPAPTAIWRGTVLAADRSGLGILGLRSGERVDRIPARGDVLSGPSVGGDRFYLFDSGAGLRAFDGRTGREDWNRSGTAPFGFAQAAAGTRVVAVGAGMAVRSYGAANGTVAWRHPVPATTVSSPSVGRSQVYVAAVANGSTDVVALDRASGDRDWRIRVPRTQRDYEGVHVSPPSLTRSSVLVATAAGKVHRVAAATGAGDALEVEVDPPAPANRSPGGERAPPYAERPPTQDAVENGSGDDATGPPELALDISEDDLLVLLPVAAALGMILTLTLLHVWLGRE